MATFELVPERRTLHGHFSRDLPPVLTIDSGDTVRCTTLDVGWGEQLPADATSGVPPAGLVRDAELDAGHALLGPIAVRGAEPGMALEIAIGALRPGAWGNTWTSHRQPWYRYLNVERYTATHWTMSADRTTATSDHGHTVRLRPFLGIMGNAPAEPGRHPTSPPRVVGGNMDCKELVNGSTLWLPVGVTGALFSLGDGHALQGDGEVAGTALECPFDVAELTFTLRPDLHLRTPRANTPAGWLTLGFGATLDDATAIALSAMLDLLGEMHGLSRDDALALASLVVDLHITQIVNGTVGVHAILPHGAL
ncbi:MAG: acetamidase/formamidase family protein [Ktedonobacterales bacterium]|nr:acetamidase/formamidase family protein [Ktedonobacterales bacterium]